MSWNLDDYEPVEDRLAKFWADHPEGSVVTDLEAHTDSRYVVRAQVWKKAPRLFFFETHANTESIAAVFMTPDATGLAEETVGSTPVNKTSALENCETSAIGRALANLGYAAKGKRPSREEMDKPARAYESKSDEPVIGKYQCPACGGQVYDNRSENAGTNKPLWKCSVKNCGGGKNGYSWASWEEDPGEAGLIGPAPIRDDFEPRDDIPLPEPQEFDDPSMAPF